jgi:hypothetical protein
MTYNTKNDLYKNIKEYILLYYYYITIPFRIFIIFFTYFVGTLLCLIFKNSDIICKFIIRSWAIIMTRMHSFNIIYDKKDIYKYEYYMKTFDKLAVIYNHRNIYDAFILICICDNITFLLNRNLPSMFPLFSIIFNAMKMVYVDKGTTTKNILNYTNNRKAGDRMLAIAPDAGKYPENPDKSLITKFNTGAFVGMFPLIPIIIKYEDCNYLDFKYDDFGETFLHCFIKGFLNHKYNVRIKILDIIYPDENSTIEQYRDKAYNIMNEEYNKM